ncbi:TfpX/TfpZ family type IV pilin accessory protein [Undibacterium parvum]|uniref:Pilus assembly protein n=1 Tax=Undibacterium parvum TaxID=401471 RepID=A0A3Q9BPQ9_9BURK|nr:TfpX/TfpZ family type IV pilin accessory protein [Undibacterium parvum]AZP10995.1 pilus assembly protein [Undibacterium parvum]
MIAATLYFSSRWKAFSLHIAISTCIALLSAALVFGLWYPWPYRVLAGGQTLFFIVLAVDLILGPLLTFVIFDISKSKAAIVLDLCVIGVLQIIGLGYGLHIVFQARPVAMVFEVDRFRIISDLDVRKQELPSALPGLQQLSLSGPKLLGTRKPKNADEQFEAIELGMQGVDIGVRPSFWQPYSLSIPDVLSKARPLSSMYSAYPKRVAEIKEELKKINRLPDDLRFLPLTGRQENWSILVDAKSGEVLGYLPVDGFLTQ